MDSAIIAAVVAFLKALFGIRPKDPMQEVYKENAQIAEADAKAFAAPDRDRADVDHVLRLHADK